MEDKPIYSELEIDCFPDKESIQTITQFLQSLKQMAEALNKSSEIAVDGGAGFSWRIKITAEGEWT